MNCAEIQLILSQGPDVTDEEIVAFDAHVATCPTCHAALDQLQSQADSVFKILGYSESRPPTATLTAIRSSLSSAGRVRSQPTGGQLTRRPMQIALAALILLGVWYGGARLGPRLTETHPSTAGNETATAIHPVVADDVPTPTHDGGLSPITTTIPTPTNGSVEPSIERPTEDPMVTPSIVIIPRSPVPHLDDAPTTVLSPLPTITHPVVPTVDIPTALPPSEVPVATVGMTPPPTVIAPTAVGTVVPPTAIATPSSPPTAITTPPGPPTAITTPPSPPTAITTPPSPPTATPTSVDIATPTPTSPPTSPATSVPTATPTSEPPPLTPTPTPSGRGLAAHETIL